MTARLNIIPAMEMRIIGPENEFRFSGLKIRRFAIKIPVFKFRFYVIFKDIKYCIIFIRQYGQIQFD